MTFLRLFASLEFFLVVVVLAKPVYPKSIDLLSVTVRGHEIHLARIPESHMTISKKCFDAKNGNCEAMKALSSISLKKLKQAPVGGQELGCLICLEQTQGKLALGITDERNEISLCEFSDASFVGCGTLSFNASENDLRH